MVLNRRAPNRRAILALLAATARSFTAPRTRQPASVVRAADVAEGSDDSDVQIRKAMEAMTSFSNRYVKVSNTKYCKEPSVPAVVIRGLAEHKVTLGAPLCPCRNYVDKAAEAKAGYWNCPCVPMRERKECHCMLFLTEDNGFAGDSTEMTMEEVDKHT
mmetsp:Transcript_8058/g.25306  ORF Transcript_8058/g.25306 Transcript_8058/m.25306 type:complete len:159 (-) Transcript_8058:16-492(-)